MEIMLNALKMKIGYNIDKKNAKLDKRNRKNKKEYNEEYLHETFDRKLCISEMRNPERS